MIDYATWCAIREGVASHLTAPQLAASLGLDVKTVRHWIDRPYAPRAPVPRASAYSTPNWTRIPDETGQ
jgi:hypothetical protein